MIKPVKGKKSIKQKIEEAYETLELLAKETKDALLEQGVENGGRQSDIRREVSKSRDESGHVDGSLKRD